MIINPLKLIDECESGHELFELLKNNEFIYIFIETMIPFILFEFIKDLCVIYI